MDKGINLWLHESHHLRLQDSLGEKELFSPHQTCYSLAPVFANESLRKWIWCNYSVENWTRPSNKLKQGIVLILLIPYLHSYELLLYLRFSAISFSDFHATTRRLEYQWQIDELNNLKCKNEKWKVTCLILAFWLVITNTM